MRVYLKKRLNHIKNDKIELYTLMIAAALSICHFVLFYESQTLSNLSSLFFCLVFLPINFFIGRKAYGPFFYIFSVAIMLTGGTYKNYSAAWFATLSIIVMKPRYKLPFVLFHTAITIAVCYMHQKTPIHLTVYILNALFLYVATIYFFKQNSRIEPLDLTDDERAILEEMKNGKQQKEITLFSVNTITKKIRDARTRNGLNTTAELLMRYINEKAI